MSRSLAVRSVRPALVLLLVGAISLAAPVASAQPTELAPKHVLKNVKQTADDVARDAQAGGRKASSNGIAYHGGPVLLGPVHPYVIWYGTWTTSAKGLVQTFFTGIGGSPYFNINTTYYDGQNRHVPNSVTYKGSTTDAYSQGSKNLSDTQVASIVSTALNSGKLPVDPNGVYFVFTSVDVSKNGFLSSYCGWHTAGTYATTNIKYAFVGDPGNNAACAEQTSVSPNGNVGADAMASVISHELEEATTDPDLNAWYDQRGMENADKCAWTFGTTYNANGALANMSLGGRNFLIQRNWVNASGGYCSLSY